MPLAYPRQKQAAENNSAQEVDTDLIDSSLRNRRTNRVLPFGDAELGPAENPRASGCPYFRLIVGSCLEQHESKKTADQNHERVVSEHRGIQLEEAWHFSFRESN